MPPRPNDTHRHTEPKPAAPRRKSKPKFELPAETAPTTEDVGWVYRADEAVAPVQIAETVAEVAAEVRHVPADELAADAVLAAGQPAAELPPLPPVTHAPPNMANLALMAGLGVFALGALATGLVSIAAFTLMAAPVRMVRGLFSGK